MNENKKDYMFINLLPYREVIKKEQKKSFFTLMGLFAIMSGLLILLLFSYLSYEIESQKSRNGFIESQNKKLDEKIKSISSLREEIRETLAKRKVVENLQVNRSDVVNILNTVSNQLPEGVYLKKVVEVGNKITITGNTYSNNSVSLYMTNLVSTNVFINPQLIEVKSLGSVRNSRARVTRVKDDRNVSEFTLNVYLKPKLEDDDLEKLIEKPKTTTSSKTTKAKK